VIYNRIEFSLQEWEAGVWRWEYMIGQLIKTGELLASSRAVAVRKVRQKIDRDLRMQYLAQRERRIQF
jgi:hypothetical protein